MLSFKNILCILFGIVLPLFLVINLFMFFNLQYTSGIVPFIDGNGHSYWDTRYYYFGTQSILAWTKAFPRAEVTNWFDNKMSQSLDVLRVLINNTVNLEVLNFLVGIYQGLLNILRFFVILGNYIWEIFSVITWFFTIFSGMYNVPLPNFVNI